MSGIRIRPAQLSDLPAIHAIQVHYVRNTVMNFCYKPVTLEEMIADYKEVLADGFPYFVAVPQDDASEDASQIEGYAYVHGFRGRSAYQYSGELSIFNRPDCTGRGVGKALMNASIAALRESSQKAKDMRSASNQRGRTEGVENDVDERAQGRPRDIHQLLVCMTVNPDEADDDKLRRFYVREGFVETARLKKVGWKFGQWLDTRYMQLEV